MSDYFRYGAAGSLTAAAAASISSFVLNQEELTRTVPCSLVPSALCIRVNATMVVGPAQPNSTS